MRWIIQSNMSREPALVALPAFLERYGIPFDMAKVVPFGGGIALDVEPDGPAVSLSPSGPA